jgi:hypothetical protein
VTVSDTAPGALWSAAAGNDAKQQSDATAPASLIIGKVRRPTSRMRVAAKRKNLTMESGSKVSWVSAGVMPKRNAPVPT